MIMAPTKSLIQLLSGGDVHSGADLARALGVSRTAVWKQIRRAQKQGHRIETLRSRGYRLLSAPDLLDAEVIRAGVDESLAARMELCVLQSVDSTNAEIMRHPRSDSSAIRVCMADAQTAGRGRRGRVWQSPPGQNLYLSLGLSLPGGLAALEGLSLVAGVAVAEALEALGLAQTDLKWPNDLQCNGRKLAGILIELQGELEGSADVVIGVGLNVHMTEAEGVDQPWISLAQAEPDIRWSRNSLAAELIGHLCRRCLQSAEQGFSSIKPAWERRDVLRDRLLVATQGELQGTGAGIDDAGQYLIRNGQGVTAVRAGEISLRVAG